MKPYKIFKNGTPTFHKKVRIITELKEPKIPLKYFKGTCSPSKVDFVWEKTTEDQ